MINNSRIENLKKRNEVILTTIDTLLDIRLTLTVRKLIDKTIAKLEFKKIIDNAKIKHNNLVRKEIDNAFEDYFPVNKKNVDSDKKSESMAFDEMQDSLNKEKSFEDKGEEKGKALSFNNGRFSNNNSSDLPKAA